MTTYTQHVVAILEIAHASAGPVLSDQQSRQRDCKSEFLFAEFHQAMVGTRNVGYHLRHGFVAFLDAKFTKCYARLSANAWAATPAGQCATHSIPHS